MNSFDADLENILSFELIEELSAFFLSQDKSDIIESLLIFAEKAFSLVESRVVELNGQNLWIGLSSFQGKQVIKVRSINIKESFQPLHEMYRTDANVLIGNAKFDHTLNKFITSDKKHFFIESWEGNMSGSYSPFKVEIDNFRYKKTA